MPDYRTLIDAQTWAFIDETNRWYPADAVNQSVAGQRQVYDAMCRAFAVDYPVGVSAHDIALANTTLRQYDFAGSEPAATVLYFHGGGFVVGGLHSHDDICAEICAATGLRVISVDYRLAPEHEHPAAFEDASAALSWLRSNFTGTVVLAGDSAGGCLAAAVAQDQARARDIVGQVLIYPGLGGDMTGRSYVDHAKAPLLTIDDLLYYADIRGPRETFINDPSFAPLAAHGFSGLPSTFAVAAECDPLADDAAVYCERVRRAGGVAVSCVEHGLVHGYLRARHSGDRAKASFQRILTAIDLMASGRPLTVEALGF